MATVAAGHWPHYAVDRSGVSYTASDALWGGDDVTYTAPTSFLFNEGARQLLSGGSIDWANDTIKARLVDASVTPDRDETVMTGYTAVGTDQTLAGKTKTTDTATDRIVLRADPPSFAPGAGYSAATLVVYKFVTNDADSIPLICLVVSVPLTVASPVNIRFAAAGLAYLQE